MSTIIRQSAGVAACFLVLATAACQREAGPATAAASGDAAPALAMDTEANGEITRASRLNLNDGSRSATFSLDLQKGQAVSIDASAVFCGRIALFAAADDGGLELRGGSTDSECGETSGRQTFSRSLVATRSGPHTIAVSGRSPADFGPFTVTAKAVELQTDRALVAGDDIHGQLDSDEHSLQLKIEEAGRYQFDLSSSEFDPVLRLRGEGVTQEDDDGGDGTDSRLVSYLQPGDYRLVVARIGDANGLFRLQVTHKPMQLPEGVELKNDGELAAGALTGLLQGEGNDYQLVVAERSRFEFALDSTEVDPRIAVIGDNTHVGDDDSGDETNAHLIVTLDPGTYTVTVDDAAGANAGVYTLETTVTPASGERLRLQPGASQSGRLEAAEQVRYALTVGASGRYEIKMESSSLDSVLTLMRDGEVVANDDDGGGGNNARIDQDLDPGEYEVIASSFEGGHGTYRIELQTR